MLTIDTTTVDNSSAMDLQAIDQALLEIVSKREAIRTSEDRASKTKLQKELSLLEEAFNRNYEMPLRNILEEVYDDLSPDATVHPPLEYLANQYKTISKNSKGPTFDVNHRQGIEIDTDEYGANFTRLVIIPNPLRVILNIDDHSKEEVWSLNF